ncbi:MAG: prolyl aminopeptidase [Rhodospirillaceae bacterium]|jgi:proline iminopeptidase
MFREQLFPPIEPFEIGQLELDPPHKMYWEQSGNPMGVPALFLHGGPGAGATPVHRRFFDPEFYRIVVFDQRGAGRSEPQGCLEKNTTPDLIADIERLREYLGIEKWLVFGGSWGSTLAIAYGEAYPERCLGFILRGIFLGNPRELEWFLYGMQTVFPENWRRFVSPLTEHEREDILGSYHRKLLDPDDSVRLPAARAWSAYEGSCSTLMPSPETVAAFSGDRLSSALARIEAHYFVNDLFIRDGSLIENIDIIRAIPATIIQGRFDMVCPIITADSLHRAWPEANYLVVPDAGHSAMEPGIRAALLRATENFKNIA